MTIKQAKNFSLDEILKRQIKSTTPIEEEKPLVRLNGALFCKVGGISVVMGKPKAGKSTVIEVILTLALANQIPQNFDTLGFEVTPSKNKKVVIIDTEQSKGDVKEAIQRVKNNLKLQEDPENLLYLYLRQDDIDDRRIMIKSVLENINNIQLLILDGYADFVKDPVSAVSDCKSFVSELLSYSDKYQLGIIGAIHQNFDNAKTVGHLGSELEKKSNGIIQVEKKGDHHIISTTALRKSANFEPIYFKKNAIGNAYKIDKNEANNNGESSKNNKVESFKELLRMAFTEGDRVVPVLDKKELKLRIQRLQNPKESKPIDATRKQADRAISFMFDNLLITTDGSPEKIKRLNTI